MIRRTPFIICAGLFLSGFVCTSVANPSDWSVSNVALPKMADPGCRLLLKEKKQPDILSTLVKSGLGLEFNNRKYIRTLLAKKILLDASMEDPGPSFKGFRVIKGGNIYRKVSVLANSSGCTYNARYRLTGDLHDHHDMVLSSIKVKLKGDSLGGIRNFKLFLPESRGEKAEVLTSYLFRYLGFLSPRTALIKVKVNEKFLVSRLFQEDIDEAFLENNKIHESYIFGGNEKFGLARPFATPIIRNEKLIANDNDRLRAESKLHSLSQVYLKTSLLNFQNQAHGIINAATRDAPLNPDFFPIRSRKEIRKFTMLSVAMNLMEGLTKDDSRFVYDSVSDRFRPIYYDGHAKVAIKKLENSELGVQFEIYPDDIAPLINELTALDVKSVVEDLNGLGVNYSPAELNTIIKNIIYNLKGQYSMPYDSVSNIDRSEKLALMSSWVSGNKQIEQLFLVKLDDNIFEKCFVKVGLDAKCEGIIMQYEPVVLSKLLVSQSLDLINKDLENAIFLDFSSSTNSSHSSLINLELNELPGVEFMMSKSLKITISEINRTIKIARNLNVENPYSDAQIHIRGGEINNWQILIDSGVLGYRSENMEKSHSNSLSGCLTFSDIYLQNLDVTINESRCEDGVHFVRTTGINLDLTLGESFSDSIDSDFSNIEFGRVKVNGAGNDCIDLSAGVYSLRSGDLSNCGDKGVSVGEKSYLSLENLSILGSGIGVASKDSSIVDIDTYSINDSSYCLVSYRKKGNYLGGIINVIEGECLNSKIADYYRQEGSAINF